MRCRWVFPLGASTLPLLPTGHRYGRTSALGTEPRGASAWTAGFLRVHPLGSGHTAYPTLAFQTAIPETGQTTAQVPFRARCPRAAAGGWARAAGPGRRTKAARSAGRAAGVGARLSDRRRWRRRRRRARACIPQKRPEPAGRRHPRLRPHPSQSKVTLD